MTKKHEQKQKKEKSLPALPFKNQLTNGVILLLILALFSLSAFFMTDKILEPTNLGKLLPAEQTIGFLTIDINSLQNDITLPSDYILNYDNLSKMVASYLNQESFDMLGEWFDGQSAIAFLSDPDGNMDKIYFLGYQDRTKALDFLKTLSAPGEQLASENYEGVTIYSYPTSQNLNVAFISGYMVLSDDASNLELVIDSNKGSASNLKTLANYNTVADNLPYEPTILTFWNIQKYPDIIESYVPIYEVVPEALIKPILAIFTGFGAAVQASEEGFYVQTYTSVEKELLEDNYYLSFPTKYNAGLSAFIPENPTIFIGGLNLRSETERTFEIFDEFHPSASLILQGVLDGVSKKFFGKQINFEEEIYPLLEEEYALSIYKNVEGGKEYLCLLELENQEEKMIYIDTIKKGFLEKQVYSDPYIQTYTLGDGTTGQEIVADPVEILNEKISYEDVEIDKFYLSNDDILGYMTVFDDKFAFATDLDILRKSIDLMKTPNGSLQNSADMDSINALMGSADESSFIDISALKDSEFWGQSFFSAFSSLSSTKNFFDDGVATFHLLK
ncbi:MAG: hypothetical protein UV80_C0005G0080 [Candidatus Peregrinibacteria bacterium GW2011_GWF2_43_17]|nr:MAG: hypothetical protein UV80_C0005G0080 [Candidatus Peregrinibacteria bacterium GW2011_GWF2_43_17]HAU40004.1 hypothetical protein [Candidatus Peregrinibacteria bacterium]